MTKGCKTEGKNQSRGGFYPLIKRFFIPDLTSLFPQSAGLFLGFPLISTEDIPIWGIIHLIALKEK